MITSNKEFNIGLVTVLFLFLSAWWVFLYFINHGQPSHAGFIWGSSYQIVAIFGGFSGFFVSRAWGGRASIFGRAIIAFAAGLLLQSFGQSVFGLYINVFHIEVAYPSLADLGFFGSIPCYIWGILQLAKASGIPITLRIFLRHAKITVIPVLFLAISYQFFLRGYQFDWSQPLKIFLDFAYPLGEAMYVSLALLIYFLSRGVLGGVMKNKILLILLALVAQYIADFNFLYQAAHHSWVNGGYGDYLYLVAYYLMAVGLMKLRTDYIATNVLMVVINSFFFIQFLLSGSNDKFIVNGLEFVLALAISWQMVRGNKRELHLAEERARVLALEESNRQLQELDHQKTEFLTIAAHQLRTPVSIIKNYVAMLQDGDYGEVNNEVKKVHHNIGESNEWLVRLADEFLNISNLESGQTKYHVVAGDISRVARAVAVELAPKATAKGLTLAVADMPNSLLAHFDVEKIQHTILNLVDNAIKYSEHGTITISVKNENNGMAVRVTDQGMGFDKEDAKKFFQKFQRGENAKQYEVNTSTGLGLYIARMFVEGHGGKVWAKSEGLNRGSEFGFYLPEAKI